MNKPEWLPDWFDLKNYDSVADMGLKEWACALDFRSWLNRIVDRGYTTEEAIKNLITESLISSATSPDVVFDPMPENFEWRQTVSPVSIGMIGTVWGDITFDGDAARLKRNLEKREAPGNAELVVKYLKLSAASYDEFLQARYREGYGALHEWEEQRSNYGSELIGLSFAQVKIDAPDEKLIEDFKTWLKDIRKLKGKSPEPQNFTLADMADWHAKRVLPYIDLIFWAKLEGINITQQEIGIVLFPDDYAISLSDRVRRTVKPLAEKLMRSSTIGAIGMQAGVSIMAPNY